MFASGNSQFAFLDALTARDDVPWERLTGFHMDEYVGMDDTHPASFARYMRERIVDVVHPAAFHYVDGTNDAAAECARYAELLTEASARPLLPRHRRERTPRVQRSTVRRLRRRRST